MRRFLIPLVLFLVVVAAACSRPAEDNLKPGTAVTVTLKDGSVVTGRLVESKPDQIVVDPFEGGEWKTVPRSQLASIKQTEAANTSAEPAPPVPASPGQPGAPAVASQAPVQTPAPSQAKRKQVSEPPSTAARTEEPPAVKAPPPPEFRELTVAAGTVVHVRLDTAVASNTSQVEDPVSATVTTPVAVDEMQAIPAGSVLRGVVTAAKASGKVKGRAELALRFDTLRAGGDTYRVGIEPIGQQAQSTKKKDAAKIGIGAGAGAIIGGLVGGGKGAAIGAGVGGGAGTAAVLATSGDEVKMAAGTAFTVTLAEPLTVRVRLR